MDIYSPDLANAQQELLFLKNNSEAVLLESAKKKLLFMGFTQSQIDQVLQSGKISPTVSVYSPYSGYVAEFINTGRSYKNRFSCFIWNERNEFGWIC
jgi:hypothetical protein